MDDFNAYLARLAQDLKQSLSPAEQEEILAEIESHIEEGLEDRRLGAEEAERGAKVLAELGSPTEMADGLYYAVARRWQGLALALIPLAIIFLIRATIIQLWLGEQVIIPDDFYLVDLAMMPLYAVMLKVVWRRNSRPLMLWWLSWSSLYSTRVLLQAMMRETPLWALLILWLLFCLSLSTFAVKLWQARQDGLLVAFATLPYALSVIQFPMQTTAMTYFSPLEQTLSVAMYQFHLLCYIPLAGVIFLMQERQKRWRWLITTIMLYVVLLAWLLSPMPLIYFLPYWLVLSLPLITGLLIDYRQTPPFLST